MRSQNNRRRSRRRRSRRGGRSRSGRSRVRSITSGSRVRSRAGRQGSPVQRQVQINAPIQPMMNLMDPSRSRSSKRLRQRDPSLLFLLRDLTEAMEQKEGKEEKREEKEEKEEKEENDESVTPVDSRLTRTRSSTRARRITY